MADILPSEHLPMRYLALGDSISVDDYTGVPGGGAASQFARLIGADEFENRTHDGCTTDGVLAELSVLTGHPHVVTLTAGGNDFLQAAFWIGGPRKADAAVWDMAARRPTANLQEIAKRLAAFGCPVIINTIYDPTDGDDSLIASMGMTGTPRDFRAAFDAINDGIRALARAHGFLMADLQELFHGHGMASSDPWLTGQIEPNHAGATAIAARWYRLFRAPSMPAAR